MRRIGVKGLGVCGVICAVAAGACDDGGPPASCPTQGAAFVVMITAGDSPLPADTEITVRYGGLQEVYRLAAPPCIKCPDVLFCDALNADGGIGDAGLPISVHALRCEIWTGGSATLEVRASSYADLTEELAAESDGCGGVLTREIPIELEPLDGAP